MLVYAGIDEAGYGPMLGPLCIGCSAFALQQYDPADGAPDLWRILSNAVCQSRRDRRRRIAIDDSKELKGPNSAATHPLRHLERGVLACCLASGASPRSDDGLFDHLQVRVPEVPWYDSSTPLPLAHTADELRVAASVLQRALAGANVRLELMRCEVIAAGEFNRQVEAMRNKANVNLCGVMRRLDELWRRWPRCHPRVIVDRLGGRIRYLRTLQLSFPEAQICILTERPTLSRYQLDQAGSRLTVSFVQHAERQHLPTALASMIAKYVRELMMIRLNRYFQAQLPRLRPTAGYVKDARRYLIEIEPVMKRLSLSPSQLVRSV
ncbi:MAG: hypothetical protein IH830_07790 [Planctomycetes bacterium]|nr:hypothetical protein [Planctomycetota bacterium]